ncbi:MBL fold metallo-hydrolase [Bradyrhizobium sp. 151]|jgi:glyoxylase-like metal-dependent hydrolase (beta-lactamase superfamily II)|uniref:MBL fold metallo-hydrolase n=1 Tax=Bradyrhizobium sp. 151 TaxID=2782626 RepID=UPI001FF8C9E7|nr:MBL fold metallo-hydrolase [Bradyrhizobium sp. 151]MCK1656126.1 MBL fold metallo-hydrolase [Bradyrhizobium sp. 151]
MRTLHQHAMSRRSFCLCCMSAATFAATGGWLTPSQAFAEARNIVDMIRDDAAKSSIKVHRLRHNVSILEGSGGNIAVFTGPDGKVFVDGGITASRLGILAAANGLSSDPIRYLINTHWHFDHSDGNAWLNAEGAAIIAHENTQKHLLVAERVADWNFNFTPSPLAAIPTEVFTSEKSLTLNGSILKLKHYGPAHTDSDISVTITEADILHCGDTYWNGIYPFIDYSTGGNIDGLIKAAEENLAAASGKTIVIPGHGQPVSNRTELRAFRDMLIAIRENVAKLKQQGRSLEETTAARPTAAFDADWGRFVITPAFFTRLVYEGV